MLLLFLLLTFIIVIIYCVSVAPIISFIFIIIITHFLDNDSIFINNAFI